MICAQPPPSREILDPVARPLYCRVADWRSFTVEAIVIASTVRARARTRTRLVPPSFYFLFVPPRSISIREQTLPSSFRASECHFRGGGGRGVGRREERRKEESNRHRFGRSPICHEIFSKYLSARHSKPGNVAHSSALNIGNICRYLPAGRGGGGGEDGERGKRNARNTVHCALRVRARAHLIIVLHPAVIPSRLQDHARDTSSRVRTHEI